MYKRQPISVAVAVAAVVVAAAVVVVVVAVVAAVFVAAVVVAAAVVAAFGQTDRSMETRSTYEVYKNRLCLSVHLPV